MKTVVDGAGGVAGAARSEVALAGGYSFWYWEDILSYRISVISIRTYLCGPYLPLRSVHTWLSEAWSGNTSEFILDFRL